MSDPRNPNKAKNPIQPTPRRVGGFADHQPPTGRHSGGNAEPWKGTKRILNPAGRRRWNQRTWDRLRRNQEAARAVMKEETHEA